MMHQQQGAALSAPTFSWMVLPDRFLTLRIARSARPRKLRRWFHRDCVHVLHPLFRRTSVINVIIVRIRWWNLLQDHLWRLGKRALECAMIGVAEVALAAQLHPLAVTIAFDGDPCVSELHHVRCWSINSVEAAAHLQQRNLVIRCGQDDRSLLDLLKVLALLDNDPSAIEQRHDAGVGKRIRDGGIIQAHWITSSFEDDRT